MNEVELIMRHTHDCDKCKPLGQFLDWDMYYCDEAGSTVVARHGSYGHDYVSGLALTIRPEIKVAVCMAKAAGYLDGE